MSDLTARMQAEGTLTGTIVARRGLKGDKGDTGDMPDFSVGTVTTVDAGEDASVTITGTQEEPEINFEIPRGAVPDFSIGTVQSGATASATITGTDEAPVLNLTLPKGDKGDKGNTGATPNITIGSVITGAEGTNVIVTNTGSVANPVFNFTIPRGNTGETGNGIESIELTSTSGGVKTYTITFTDETTTTFEVTDGEVTEERLAEALTGTYPDLTAGNIISNDAYNEDTEPYLYRAMPYVSKRLEDVLVGGTVAWNQQAPNTELTGIGSRASAPGTRIVKGHKYLFGAYLDVSETLTTNAFISPYGFDDGTATTFCLLAGRSKGDIYKIDISTASGVSDGTGRNVEGNFWFYVNAQTGSFKNLKLFDLTAMFGSTIADYIYSLEQATAGAGVAWFRKLFPKPYYAYNAGELMSVNTSAHNTVGFNQWDEEWELGGINTAGEETTTAGYYRSKNYVPILPSESYYMKFPVQMSVMYYDADKSFINWISANGHSAYQVPSNARYLRFRNGTANSWTPYQNDICINLSDPTRNGEYEPYQKHTYPLDSSLTLRGVPKLDSSNRLYYDGDIYESDGTVTRKYGVVTFDGSSDENISAGTSGYPFRILLPQDSTTQSVTTEYTNTFANYLTQVRQADPWGVAMTFSRANGQGHLYFKITDSMTDISELRTYLANHPLIVVYELATPTTETTTPFEQYQICETGGTEEYTTTNDVPVGHETKYYVDLAKKLVDLPFDMSMIAPVETTYKATRNYSVGDYLIVNNTFYKVTSSIANGGTITPNTNVTATTVATELIALR